MIVGNEDSEHLRFRQSALILVLRDVKRNQTETEFHIRVCLTKLTKSRQHGKRTKLGEETATRV
jgi:hypothetical protein